MVKLVPIPTYSRTHDTNVQYKAMALVQHEQFVRRKRQRLSPMCSVCSEKNPYAG